MPPVPALKHFEYLVLGGGSGGIASARRAAEFGVKVGLIESGIDGNGIHILLKIKLKQEPSKNNQHLFTM